MRKTALLAAIAIIVLGLFVSAPRLTRAANSSGVALSGRVSSEKEPAMEGVIVGARKDGSPITIDVVTDADGLYSFPASRLAPGQYSLKIRAVGYEMDAPKTVEVAAGATATAGTQLRPAKNLAGRVNKKGWRTSMRGKELRSAYRRDP